MTARAIGSGPLRIEEHPFGKATGRFLDVARRVYADDPAWVSPIDLAMKVRMSPRRNPFFEHAEGTTFIAMRGGVDVGRCTAQIDREHQKKFGDGVGFFGFLDTLDDEEAVRRLLEAAAQWLRARGMRRIRGPVSLSVNEEWGLLVEGFETPPAIFMPHHRPYQGGLVEAAGLSKEKDLLAWRYDIGEVPARARAAHAQVMALPEVRIRSIDLGRMQQEVRTVVEVFNEACDENWGYVPITEAELRRLASDLKLMLIPDIALVAEVDGIPAGISIALPNLNELISDLGGRLAPLGLLKLVWRLKVQRPRSARLMLLGIRKDIRVQKKYGALATALCVEMNNRARKLGMSWGELSCTLEDNTPVNLAITRMGGQVYKRYRVYGRDL